MQHDAGGPPCGQDDWYDFGGTGEHGACRSHLIHFDEPTSLQGKIHEALSALEAHNLQQRGDSAHLPHDASRDDASKACTTKPKHILRPLN